MACYDAAANEAQTRPDCLEVSIIGYSSAILHWNSHSSTKRLNYVVRIDV